MENKFTSYLKKNGLLIALLAVALLILIALILNLVQGGFWIISGMNGKNAYELAVEEGFQGSRREWLASLEGKDGQNGVNGTNGENGSNGTNGKSAYEIACEEGFEGSLEEWLLSLQFGEDGADGQNGKNGKDGKDGENGLDGVSIVNVFINESGHLIVVLSNGERIDAGTMGNLIPSDTPKTDYQLAVEDGFTGTLHEWLCSYVNNSRPDTSVTHILVNNEGELTFTLNNGTVLNAGAIPENGNISESKDALGFYERFEMVVLYHESGALNLRDKPDITSGSIVCSLKTGTELVCIGAGEITDGDGDTSLFYRFYHNGKICYAKAKFFTPKPAEPAAPPTPAD